MMGAATTGAVAVLLTVEDSQVKPGLVGFLVVLGMAVALFFLLRSMSKHLRRIDVDRDGTDPERRETGDGPNG
jgi:urea transporter